MWSGSDLAFCLFGLSSPNFPTLQILFCEPSPSLYKWVSFRLAPGPARERDIQFLRAPCRASALHKAALCSPAMCNPAEGARSRLPELQQSLAKGYYYRMCWGGSAARLLQAVISSALTGEAMAGPAVLG